MKGFKKIPVKKKRESVRFNPKKEKLAFTIFAIVLLILSMYIYRKTFIPLWFASSIWIIGSSCSMYYLRNSYYVDLIKASKIVTFLHSILTFGGCVLFVFFGINYSITIGKSENVSLRVIKTDYMGRSHTPYVIINYDGQEKQIVFSSDTKIEGKYTVNLELAQGIFGFTVIKKQRIN